MPMQNVVELYLYLLIKGETAMAFKPDSKGVVKGTDKNDKISWVNSKDWQKALTVNALKGNDTVDFKNSKYKNKLNGNEGNDTLYGGSAADMIYVGKGNDYVNAGKGTNKIFINKNEGTNSIVKGGGTDTIVYAQEKNFNDFMFYYTGNDLIFKANNSIANLKNFALGGHIAKYVQAGSQILNLNGKSSGKVSGTTNRDLIVTKSSKDTINSGAGADVIYSGAGADSVKAGAGDDYLNGGADNDKLYGDEGTDTIMGGDGNDSLYGGAGIDSIVGGNGDDYIEGGAGFGRLFGLAGKDIIKGGADKDTIDGGDDDDKLYGGGDSDTIKGNKGNDILYGEDGNDYLYGMNDDDTLYGGKGNDLLDGGPGDDSLDGGDGNDTVRAGAGNDSVYGGYGEDFIQGHGGNDALFGEAGDDTIEGNDGDDIINGEAGNDLLRGGNGDDTIYGGIGNDTINAGAGRNTIDHIAGEGNDVIVAGGGADKLSFGGVNSIDDITASFTGNDVVFSTPNGETVTLQNALTNAHSVDTIEIGDDKYTTDRFKNLIISHDDITNGTAWHDDIQVQTSHNYPEVYAGAGNDIIHVKENSKMPYIYVGAGDDTISIDDNNSSCTIFLENGDGNNTLRGLSDSISTYSYIELEGYPLFQSIDLGSSFSYDYIKGTKEENNLVLSLTGGETFTIENYFNLSQVNKNKIALLYEFGSSLAPTGLPYYLKLDTDMVYIDDEAYERADEEHVYDVNKNNKVLMAPEVNYSREFYISGNSNDIVVQGTEEQTIRVQGNNNKIYFGGSDVSISTSDEGSTYADISCTRSSDISSYGNDTFNLRNGSYIINMSGDDKVITLNEDTEEVEIDNIGWANSTTIYQKFNGYDVSDIMLEHYSNWREVVDFIFEDHISIAYTDENGDILNDEGRNKLIFNGQGYINAGKLNIDDETVGDTVTVTAEFQFGSVIVSKTLSQMTQYVDMTNSSLNKEIDFFDKAQNGLLDNSAGVYIKGSDSMDYYSGYTFANGKVTINDAGGSGTNGDILRLDMARNQYRFFIDIDTEGNTASNDMFIFKFTNEPYSQEFAQYDGLLQYLYGNEDNIDAYIKIENSIEATKSSGVPGTWYLLDGQIEYINDNETTGGINLQQYFYSINMDVAGWLNDYNDNYDTECNSISAAIADGQAESSELISLYRIYSDDTNWANY